MYRHASTCLKGPVSRSRAWWHDAAGPKKPKTDGVSVRDAFRDEGSGEMRHDLIARVRREIANGTYETPDKWEAALGCLLERYDLT